MSSSSVEKPTLGGLDSRPLTCLLLRGALWPHRGALLSGLTHGYPKEDVRCLPRVQPDKLEAPEADMVGIRGLWAPSVLGWGAPGAHSGHSPHLDSWHCLDLLFSDLWTWGIDLASSPPGSWSS